MSIVEERRHNHQVYRRLKHAIDERYPYGQFVGIVRGQIVADAPDFRELLIKLEPIEIDPDRRLVVQAGMEYPKEVIEL